MRYYVFVALEKLLSKMPNNDGSNNDTHYWW